MVHHFCSSSCEACTVATRSNGATVASGSQPLKTGKKTAVLPLFGSKKSSSSPDPLVHPSKTVSVRSLTSLFYVAIAVRSRLIIVFLVETAFRNRQSPIRLSYSSGCCWRTYYRQDYKQVTSAEMLDFPFLPILVISL